MIEYQCPHCATVLKIPDEQAGFPGECSHCKGRITVPFPIPNLAPRVLKNADGPSRSDTQRIRCECPHCGKELSIRQENAGKKGNCNRCGGLLTVPVPSARLIPDETSKERPESPPNTSSEDFVESSPPPSSGERSRSLSLGITPSHGANTDESRGVNVDKPPPEHKEFSIENAVVLFVRIFVVVALVFTVYIGFNVFGGNGTESTKQPQTQRHAPGPGQERAEAYKVSQKHVREKIRAVMPGGVGFPPLSNVTVNYIGPDPQTGNGECYKVKAYGENFSEQTNYQAVVTKQPNGQWTCRVLSVY